MPGVSSPFSILLRSFEITTRITRVEGEAFKSEGKIITDPGWLAVYGKQAAGADEQTLCPVVKGESAETRNIEITENQTKPPARFSEGTLLSAMEGAGQTRRRRGTPRGNEPARSGHSRHPRQIIEGSALDGYLNRQGRDLIVTQKGLSLINLLRGIGIRALTSPEMTGEWEFKLEQMEHGTMPRLGIHAGIRTLCRGHCAPGAKNFSGTATSTASSPISMPHARNVARPASRESYKAYDAKAARSSSGKTWPDARTRTRRGQDPGRENPEP